MCGKDPNRVSVNLRREVVAVAAAIRPKVIRVGEVKVESVGAVGVVGAIYEDLAVNFNSI